MNAISPTKTYKCKVCKSPYTKRNTWQSLCGSESCAIKVANNSKAKRDRLDRAVTRQKIDGLATYPQLVKKAQIAFNGFIRARDFGTPCICCGKPIAWGTASTGGVCDAGHYRSVGSAPHLRFNPDNVHAQLKNCNQYKSGNAVDYRLGLIQRIGQERVDILEADQCLRKYTKDGLRELAKQYRDLTKQLTKEKQ